MEKKSWYQNPEMIIGLCALLVSLVAVFVGVYSAYTDRTYARASVWPRLEIMRSFGDVDEKGAFKYAIYNNGTGPAIIKGVKVSHKGQYVRTWKELFALYGADDVLYTQSHIGNRIMPAESHIFPIIIRKGLDDIQQFLDTEGNENQIEIFYCSIYEECWTVSRKNLPQPIEACEVDPEQRFRQ